MNLAGKSPELSFEPLTPLHFLERAALVHPDRTACVSARGRTSYQELRARVLHFSGALRALGVESGDRVAVISPNSPLLLEAHYAVPAAGAVLVALNFRLSPHELRAILAHAEPRLLLCDRDLRDLAAEVVEAGTVVLDDDDLAIAASAAEPYEERVADERSLLSLNYTSGTTGAPKGVMYHHRGAYLQALSMAYHARLEPTSVFLWTLPMFHCHGWCFTWAVTAAGATHVCLPKPHPEEAWRLVHAEGVTHLNGAPTVLTMLAQAAGARPPEGRRIRVCAGGSPPSPTLLTSLDDLGMDVTHLYGLTETFGPVVVNEGPVGAADVSLEERARFLVRQGVGTVVAVPPRVIDAEGHDVPADGRTVGELALRGNPVMGGYYRDPDLTASVAPDGWFRSGDLAVRHADGYVEIRDRSKDVIISGGENIASVEVEHALLTHPAVLEAAVVAGPDERWGEVPVAFVTLRDHADADAEELIAHAKSILASFKAPKRVIFGPLPKTATGKIQKFALRAELWSSMGKAVN